MNAAIRYVVASTERRSHSDAAGQTWLPAGQMHALCLGMRGVRPSVAMCGHDLRSLHVFEARRFPNTVTGTECSDCRAWVRANAASTGHSKSRRR